MSKNQLPESCRIERLGEGRDRAFILVFENGIDPYRSEIYHPEKGETLDRAARRICERYDWLRFPPGELPNRCRIRELKVLIEETLDEWEGNNFRRFVPDGEKAWKELFSFNHWSQKFDMDDDYILACGDPPIPERSCGEGWSGTHYTMKFSRGPKQGHKRGVERVEFWSYYECGDRDCSAEFIRHAGPGLDCWDEEEFAYEYAKQNCYWTLLKYKYYQLWCLRHGEDPMGNVMPEWQDVQAVVDVKLTTTGNVSSRLIEGDKHLVQEAEDYVCLKRGERRSWDELIEALESFPKGRDIREERVSMGLAHGWKPQARTKRSATLRVEMRGRQQLPITPERIRKISGRKIEEEIVDLVAGVNRMFPKP